MKKKSAPTAPRQITGVSDGPWRCRGRSALPRFAVPDLLAGRAYRFRVAGVNAAGRGLHGTLSVYVQYMYRYSSYSIHVAGGPRLPLPRRRRQRPGPRAAR